MMNDENENPARKFVRDMNLILNELLADIETAIPNNEYERGYKAGAIAIAQRFSDTFASLN